jgi:hypothetical protein
MSAEASIVARSPNSWWVLPVLVVVLAGTPASNLAHGVDPTAQGFQVRAVLPLGEPE